MTTAPKFERITIRTVNPDGWPIDFDITPEPGATASAIEYLARMGYNPAPTADAGRESQYQYTPEGLPFCPKHREVMQKREKQGDIWYSHGVEDAHGERHYCRGYQSKNSPGWDIG